MNKQQITKAKKLRAKRLRAKGLTYQKIGEAIGVHGTTVNRWLNPEYADKNRVRNRKWESERWANDPKYRERKRERGRERKHKRRNTIELRVNDCLSNSKHQATKYGYVPCTTPAEVIIAAFTGKCDSCGVDESTLNKKLAMDHCHLSGHFRAWLCERCNHVEGQLAERGHLVAKMISDWFIANGPETQKALAKFGKRHVTIRRNHPKKSNVRP